MRRLLPPLVALVALQSPLGASDTRRLWDFAPFSAIRRSKAERGAPPNGQPLAVAPDALAQLLGAVRFQAGKQDLPLFASAELPALAQALAEALALAGPGEDLELVSTWKRDAGFLGGTAGVTARVFAREGGLNLIVHDARLDFLPGYLLENRLPDFDHGSRTVAGSVVLRAPGASVLRPDWLVLPLPAAAPPAQAGVQLPPQAAAPLAAGQATVEERLRDLKRFRDEGLVTEQDYERQKGELLRRFQEQGNGGHPPAPAGTP